MADFSIDSLSSPLILVLLFACSCGEGADSNSSGGDGDGDVAAASGGENSGSTGGAGQGTGGQLNGSTGGQLNGSTGGQGSGGVLEENGTGGVAVVDGTGGETGSGGAKATADMGCGAGDYLICEDFESAPIGGTPEGWTKHGEESQVTDQVAMSGSQSLELGAIDSWERRIYRDASVLGNSHWGRIYYRVEQPVPDAFVHSTIVALKGVGPTVGAAEFRVVDTVKRAVDFEVADQAGKYQFLYNVQIDGGSEFGEGTSYLWFFEDAWHCAEWHIDAVNQSYDFYLDGESVITFERGAGNFADSEIPESFSELRVGWINYQNSPPGFHAWIDDVALDDERIGCF